MTGGGADAGSAYVDIEIKPGAEARILASMAALGAKAGARFGQSWSRTAQAAMRPVRVDVDTTRADARLQTFVNRPRRIQVVVDVDRSALNGLDGSLTGTAGRARYLGLALASIGPIAIPAIAAVTGSVVVLGSVLASAASAAGVGALAFNGIGGAVKALGEASAATSKQVQAAGTSALQAASRLQAMRDAARSVTNAEYALADAQRNTRRAQEGLNDARKEAAKLLDDLRERAKDGAISEERANQDLMKAKDDLERIQLDPRAGKVQKAEAKVAYDEAVRNLEKIRKGNKDLAKEKAEAEKKGIKNSDVVKDAEEKIRDAQRAQLQAAQALTQAKEHQALAAMRDKNAVEASVPAIDAAKKAMAGLTAEGRSFARYIAFDVIPHFRTLSAIAQKNLLPPIQKAMKSVLTPQTWSAIEGFVAKVATAMGNVAADWAKSLGDENGTAAKFFKSLGDTVPGTIEQLGTTLSEIAGIFAGLFTAAAPEGETMLARFNRFLHKWNKWVNSKAGQKKIREFFKKAVDGVAAIGRLIGKVLGFALALEGSEGFQNFLDDLGDIVTWVTDFTKAHPEVVQKALWGILAAMVAMKALNFTSKVFSGLSFLIGLVPGLGTISIVLANITTYLGFLSLALGVSVGVIVGVVAVFALLVGALVVAYFKVDWFHKAVDKVVHAIGAFFKWLWEKAIWPALKAIGKAFKWLYDKIIKPVWKMIKLAIDIAWTAIQIVFGMIRIGLKILGQAFKWLYTKFIKPTWDKYIKPILDVFGGYIKKYVKPAFEKGVEAIGKAWEGLKALIKAPIEFVVNTVLNDGIIAAYNRLAEKFGVNKVDRIKLPWGPKPAKGRRTNGGKDHNGTIGMAAGGVLPGFSPGRDIHQFFSPTAGGLALSGGEAIMRPEWAKAMGPARIAQMNKAAANGGFSLGGIWDGAKSKAGSVMSKVGSLANLIKDPSSAISAIYNGMMKKMPNVGDFGKILKSMVTKIGKGSIAKVLSFFGGGDGPEPSTGPYKGPGGGGQAALVNFGHWLQSMGYDVSEHPAFGGVTPGAHVRGSAHYAGRAIDVNHGAGTSRLEQSYLAKIIGPAHAAGLKSIFMAPGHYNHAHFSYDSGGNLPPGLTMAYNGTGRTEKVLTAEQYAALTTQRGGSTSNYTIYTDSPGLVRNLDRREQAKDRRERIIPR